VRLVEKTPSHVKYLDHIVDIFPNAKILLSVRHPIEVFSSYRRRLRAENELGNDPDWLNISVGTFINQYRDDIETGLKGKSDYPDHVKVIRYEDFVSTPDQSFSEICSFAGVPYERAPLDGKCEALATWKPDPHLARPITKSTKNWQDYMSEKEARRIEQALPDILDALGYGDKHGSS
jgi:hypothetical protein